MKNKLTKIIEKHQQKIVGDKRDYIGASSIGSECLRQIWYQYKGFESEGIPSKTKRTWDIGRNLEGLVVKWLSDSGVKVLTFDVTYSSKNVPILKGHIDALVVINKKNYILEIKTAKDASFKIFVNKGLKVWNPQYYAQIQTYMGMSGIHSAYILVLNKDNSELSDELVEFDEEFYKKIEGKALMISTAVIEPPRISNSPLWFKCKMCQYNTICHK
jgi:hypothetical protein